MSSRSSGRSWIRILVRLLVGSAIILGGTVAVLLVLVRPNVPSIPDPATLSEREASVVTSRSGTPIGHIGRRASGWTSLGAIDTTVVDALLATEDRRFYDHPGVDVRRSLSATFHTVTGDLQGGSTITQQLARNLFPDRIGTAPTLTRKALEIMTALEIERTYSKDEILEVYLNTVPFLYGAFGIEMAARTYFGASAEQLSVNRAATLVGMLKGPSYYNPIRHPERARERRNLVLRLMNETGRISNERYEEARERPLTLQFQSRLARDGPAPHFVEHVRRRLVEWCRVEGCDPYTDGLVVRTGLDLDLQEVARTAVREQSALLQAVVDRAWSRTEATVVQPADLPADRPRRGAERSEDAFAHFWSEHSDLLTQSIRETDAYRRLIDAGIAPEEALDRLRRDDEFLQSLKRRKTRLETGFVALDPTSGQIRAWVGSRDFETEQFDHVAQARRQPGSTFKPFVYAAALESGFTPESRLRDERVTITTSSGETWSPANAGATTGRLMTVREGLVHSKNTITARLVEAMGPEPIAESARRLGIRSSPLDPVPSLALGTSEVTLLEMATAYGSLARQGAYRPTTAVDSIESSEGRVLARFESSTEQVIDSTAARSVLQMMEGVVRSGTARDLRTRFGIDAPVAGKTGTTQNGADGWFFLVHPDLVAGSWVGFNDPRVRFRTAHWGQGARTGLRVVGDFAARAFERGLLENDATLPGPESESPWIHPRRVVDRVSGWVDRVVDHIRGADASNRERPAGSNDSGVSDPDGESTPPSSSTRSSEDRTDADRGGSDRTDGTETASESEPARRRGW